MNGTSMDLKSLANTLKKEGLEEKIIDYLAPDFDWSYNRKILDSLGYISGDYIVAIRNYEHEDRRKYSMLVQVRLYDKKKNKETTLESEPVRTDYYFTDEGFYDDTTSWGESVSRYYCIDYFCQNQISKEKIHYIKNIRESEGILRFDITNYHGDKKYATYAVHLDFGAIKKEEYNKEMEIFTKKRA
ncbi:MAG: hypothetical protein KatS3mg002_0123 [Candidatus Woesearchaeota archaeon]|nr:MAG: hypothetical protein KatS3mg002_0123 [Candidatus Woesearchaeota archaeon]